MSKSAALIMGELERRALDAEKERDELRAEIKRLRAGGCARDQQSTQYCAEAARLAEENAELRAVVEAVAALQERFDDEPSAQWINKKNAIAVPQDALHEVFDALAKVEAG